ncbi:hypothetical protein Unana1_01839 [Umbelopsis nana]
MLGHCDDSPTADVYGCESTMNESETTFEDSSPAGNQDDIPAAAGMFINFSSNMSDGGFKTKRKYKRAYKVNGVNILNRSEIDSKTIIERLKKRKENHNHIERKRRDHINNTIFELAEVLPQMDSKDFKSNKGSILKATLKHIKDLQAENLTFRLQLQSIRSRSSTPVPSPLPSVADRPNPHPSLETRALWPKEPSPPMQLERITVRSAPTTPRGMDPFPSYFHPQPVLPAPQPNALRPLLPKSPFSSPNIRMAGLEGQYSGACRY